MAKKQATEEAGFTGRKARPKLEQGGSMVTYRVIDGYGNEVADGIRDELAAIRLADERANAAPGTVYVVYDRSTVCTEECVGEECAHEVYRAEVAAR